MSNVKSIASMKIIYEDNHIIAVEKPVNIASQGDETGDPDMLTLLKEDIKVRYNKPGNVYLGLVHRLDRPVGGVMVFAKTSKAASRLSEQIRLRQFDKTYLAVVHGKLKKPEGTLRNFLLKDTSRNIVRAVTDTEKDAKEAILDYRVVDYKDDLSLVMIKLHTGRPHQIRVQFQTAGHPLYGDQKYGTEINKPGQQLALWSVEIICLHPTLKEMLTLKSCPPGEYPWILFNDIDYTLFERNQF